ncbi:fumarylacetoacetate hydrolase family protein [Enterovibrio norvegicus]|uniref:fumarylacetoacetate hydrolase family protein n=1 Tax=Enterovibrio norvegicus TaxID=188144 RepID=UPI0013D56CD1|nr:fumarylacetoacetate hydrolase family protein [Enterovibrio norvegicus]
MKIPFTPFCITSLFAFACINIASANDIASPNTALTLAQVMSPSGEKNTYLVQQVMHNNVTAKNISEHFDYFPDDPLNFLKQYGYEEIESSFEAIPSTVVDYQTLLAAGGDGNAHIAAGTNYAEHGEEADIDEVFLFPKFAQATPSYSQIRYQSDVLLDYEVELCMRWVDNLEKPEQVGGYVGLFVCGDFTDRAELLRKIDVDNVTSGHGFSDAKSGEKRFPTGPYIVVPKNWQTFLNDISLSTYVNGQQRQQAEAKEMLRSPKDLITMILSTGAAPIWRYEDQDVVLFEGTAITSEQNIVTGTPAGVIYNTPGWGYRIVKSLKWLATFSFVESGPIDYILEEYIAESFADNRYLQAGDKVQLTATYLGSIEVDITP